MTEREITTQAQAIQYMNNEMLWAKIIVKAWEDANVMDKLQTLAKNQANLNSFLKDMYEEFKGEGFPPPTYPDGVETRVVIDTANVVHLILPAPGNIPASPIDMVPHAF